MANRWGKNEKRDRLYFLGLQKWLWLLTAAMKLKDIAPCKKSYENLDSILESRDITLTAKDHIVEPMFFPVVMYGCESWTIKKVKNWRIDAFELWCYRRLLRVPWTSRRSNQSILNEINPDILWKDWCWSSSTLATWCEELSYWKRPWCWERLKAGVE